MPLLLLAYPRLEDADRASIQSIRARHNPEHFRLVDPHFTLVFPVDNLPANTFIAHVASCLIDVRQIPFTLRSAKAVCDAEKLECHVFLVPGRGRKAMVALHDRLYTGPLACALSRGIRFIPHITVGSSTDLNIAAALAREINAVGVNIPGAIDTVDAARLHDRRVETLQRFPLRA